MTYYHRCRPFKRHRGKVGPSKLISGERVVLLKWSVFRAKNATRNCSPVVGFFFSRVCFKWEYSHVCANRKSISFWKTSSFNWFGSTHIFTYLPASQYYFYSCFCVGVNRRYMCNYEHIIMSPYCYYIGSAVMCLFQCVIVLMSSVL